MDEQKLAQLRNHYDATDLSAEIERAHWETDVEPDPMVTTSLRLPKSVLDWVRKQAEAEHIKPTALIRRWIEQQRDEGAPGVSDRLERLVERLEAAVVAEQEVPKTAKETARRGRKTSVASRARWAVRSPVTGRWVVRNKKVSGARAIGASGATKGKHDKGLDLPS